MIVICNGFSRLIVVIIMMVTNLTENGNLKNKIIKKDMKSNKFYEFMNF